MHLSTSLDLDVVALEQSDELTLLVEIAAPAGDRQPNRRAATLQVVLDRSGSMRGGRLDSACDALLALVDRLDPQDNLGVVAFDHEVQVVVPAGPLSNKAAVRAAISSLTARGRTDLSGGYIRGLQEAQRVAGETGATLLLLSDGKANAGVTDPDKLAGLAAAAQDKQITTSTVGLGLGFDERLLCALARGGGGNNLFAEESDTAAAQIAGEVDGLLEQVAQAVSLQIRMSPAVEAVAVLNDIPLQHANGVLTAELGSFWAGETRRIALRFRVPGIAALGLAQVAELVLTSVSLPELVLQTVTTPVHVNVVPGDQAAGRIPNPVVVAEALFQVSQSHKRRASELLREGRTAAASRMLRDTAGMIRSQAATLPPEHAQELQREVHVFDDLAQEAEAGSAERALRSATTDSSHKSRLRGRRAATSLVLLERADGGATLELEVWRLAQLRTAAVAAGLELHPDTMHSGREARMLADQLTQAHALFGFFDGAADHGGFRIRRAA